MPRSKSTPGYCLHRRSGNAYATVDGKEIQLGRHGTPQSKEAYDRLIAEWLLNGRTLPASFASPGPCSFTVTALIGKFWQHAQVYYVGPDGKRTMEVENFRQALGFLNRLYGSTPAADFGPLALKAVREAMIRPGEWTHAKTGKPVHFNGWCRNNANRATARLKMVFKWAVENELVPSGVYHGISAVSGLKRGRTEARETAPIKPPPRAMVEAVAQLLPAPVRAIVELQSMCGARGGELCIMRGMDLDTSNTALWIYRPSTHKTAHHGHERKIPLGKRCQEIIRPFLKPNPQAFLFSPAEWDEQRRLDLSKKRKTPDGTGNEVGTNRSDAPKRTPGDRYTPASFRRAVARTCEKAFPLPDELRPGRVKTGSKRTRHESKAEWRARLGPEKWQQVKAWRQGHRFHPHQLRHLAATEIRKEHGLEAAGVVLGQRMMAATLIYAEQDDALAAKVMQQRG